MGMFSFTVIKNAKLQELSKEKESLQSQIISATDFIGEIEKGNLEVRYHEEENIVGGESSDHLAHSLVNLRKQMLKVSLEEKQRSWVAETRSKFMDILRSSNNDLKGLSEDIIRHLVKFLSANQGGLFLINDENENEYYIELIACYAYERKKYLTKRIDIGEGLVGQTILEKESIYMSEIPENYLEITSGLGKAMPRHLLIVPLKLEDQVFGAIEIASFNEIKDYEIDFTEQLGESIASTISNTKNNQRTRRLLEETQQQAEEMRAQEEEVRQNMEELSATQEEMQRVMKEMQDNEAFIKGLIDSTNDSVITIDPEYKIITCNKSTVDTYKGAGLEIDKGFDIFKLFTGDQKDKYKAYYDRALQGESFEVTEHYKFEEREQFFVVNYSPLRNEDGEIVAAACFGKDITEMVKAKENAEKLLEETQQQAEEMKAQEEVLRQNMEELSATQEDMNKMMQEVQYKEQFLTNILDASQDSVFVIDKQYTLINFNQRFRDALGQMGLKMEKGGDVFMVLAEEERPHHKELYDKVFSGESFEVTEHIAIADAYYLSSYYPLKNENEEVYACAVFAKDITEMVKSKKQVDSLLHESQQQAEEMKAQEEELRQNMEELSATQDDMERAMREVQSNEHYLNELINLTQDSIYTLNEDSQIISFNNHFKEVVAKYGIEVTKGFDYTSILPTEKEQKEHKKLISQVLAGETIQVPLHYEDGENEIHLHNTYSPVRDTEGKIFAVAVYSKDVTELVLAKRQASNAGK